MPTPIYINGFEHRVVSPNGAGMFSSVTGTEVTIDNTVAQSGLASLKLATTGTAQSNVRKALVAGTQLLVLSGYIRLGSGGFPNLTTVLFGTISTTGSYFSGIELSATGNIRCRTGSLGTFVASSVTMTANQWYLVEMRIIQSSTTWTVDWSIDGVDQTQVSATGQAAGDIGSIRMGTNTSTVTITAWIDDVIASVTSGDYPIGAHKTELLKPVSDGTHNAGTNVMENQAGTDIGTAWSLLDDIPMSGVTEYLKQSAIGTGNYAEVVFGTMQGSVGSVIGATAILAYTSSATQVNTAGCIITKDSFATQTTVKGASGALADYSDGSTADLYYNSVIVAALDTLSEANTIKARMGYSGDVTPNPYWVNLAVEVAFVESTDTILLDLVSYSVSVLDVTVLEHEIIPLDLVSYSVSVLDMAVLENELVLLDLVSYSISILDIGILEMENVALDLVTYPTTVLDIAILESELIGLDLVSYSIVVNDIVLLENELVSLDLVSYSIAIQDVSIVENELVLLDLVAYSIVFEDVMILEQETVTLDLVSYSVVFEDISIVISEVELLDLVSYSIVIQDISIQEDEIVPLDLISYSIEVLDLTVVEQDAIGLDLVSYSITFEDLVVLENEIVSLDLVPYSVSVYDLEVAEETANIYLDLVSYNESVFDINVVENELLSLDKVSYSITIRDISIIDTELVSLDLASYSVTVQDISIIESESITLELVNFQITFFEMSLYPPSVIVSTPITRCYMVLNEDRLYGIENEERFIGVSREERSILINQKEN